MISIPVPSNSRQENLLAESLLERLRPALERMLAEHDWAPYLYPWTELDEFLGQGNSLPIAGYGSLMNRESAARTFSSAAVQGGVPVMVFSARRVYDRLISPESLLRFGVEVGEHDRGVLNAYVTERLDDHINAVLLNLEACDLAGFREREFGYDLLPVVTVPFESSHPEPRMAYILSCRRDALDGRVLTRPELRPHPSYHEICQGGCREISSSFLEMFEQTTWVGAQTLSAAAIMATTT